MSWSQLLAALALYLVIEGMLPFINPQAFKRALAALTSLSDAGLRRWGLISMVAGVLLLYLVRA